MRRRGTWRRWAVVALLLGLAGAAAFSVQRLRAGPGLPQGSRSLPGLEAPVEVLWDSLGIPHLFAASAHDALRAQGWAHAHHRLWQMELFRRVATGRLAELFGPELVPTDRFLRTLGMHRAAAATRAALDPATLGAVEAYVEGVNAALQARSGLLPPEFLVLGVQPAPFSVADALAIEKIMAWDLSDYQLTLDLAAARGRLDDAGWEWVRPRYPADGLTILGDEPAAGAPAPASADAPLPAPATLARARIPDAALPFLEAVNAVRASNSWVVGPERSLSGRPLVANDMHLALDAPPLWYLVGIHAPGLEVVGMSIPGAPGVVAGHNRAVAWGFTNAGVDDADLFLERVDSVRPDRYLVPGGSEPFDVYREVIEVRGGTADTLLVRVTRHGPVMSDVEPRAGDELLALRWVAHDPSPTFRAILGLNRATSMADVVAALEDFRDPHQNVVFADTAGGWGYWMAGSVPKRAGGAPPPLLPVPGWTGEHEWEGRFNFREHPHALAPERGYVVTANHRQGRAPVTDRIAVGSWMPPYRAERITELLEARPGHDAGGMARLQMDVTSAFARRHRDAAAAAFRAAGLAEEAFLLEGWDLTHTLESREAPFFHAWLGELQAELRVRLYGEGEGSGADVPYLSMEAVERALVGGQVTGADGAAAALRARDLVGDATWGQLHRITLDHPLAQVPVLGRLLRFGRRELPAVGGPYTVNVAQGQGSLWSVTHGPSQRHVADLADLDGAGGFILPGGQSGWPAGRHSQDQFPRWQAGELVPLPLAREGVEARTVARVRLEPGG